MSKKIGYYNYTLIYVIYSFALEIILQKEEILKANQLVSPILATKCMVLTEPNFGRMLCTDSGICSFDSCYSWRASISPKTND